MRLHQGDFAAETVYDDDPVRVAREFAAAGAQWIHVVDLDAAAHRRAARPRQIRLDASRGGRLQGRGRRRGPDRRRGRRTLLDAGVDAGGGGHGRGRAPRAGRGALPRSTRAASRWGSTPAATRSRSGVGSKAAGADLVTLAERFEGDRARRAHRDRDRSRRHARRPRPSASSARCWRPRGIPLVASGGVGTLDDLRALAQLRSGDRRLAGIIVGRALYEGRFSVEDRRSPRWSKPWSTDAERDTVRETRSTIDQLTQRSARMANGSDVIDEGFFRRYRELLDAEDAAFDELEHAYEDGDRAHWDDDLAAWRKVVEKRCAFLEREGLVPAASV